MNGGAARNGKNAETLNKNTAALDKLNAHTFGAINLKNYPVGKASPKPPHKYGRHPQEHEKIFETAPPGLTGRRGS